MISPHEKKMLAIKRLVKPWYSPLPSGKLAISMERSTVFSWEDSLFLWPFPKIWKDPPFFHGKIDYSYGHFQ